MQRCSGSGVVSGEGSENEMGRREGGTTWLRRGLGLAESRLILVLTMVVIVVAVLGSQVNQLFSSVSCAFWSPMS